MKILVIDEEFPFPLNTGKRLRTYNLIRVLALENEVSYLAYSEPDTDAVSFMKKNNITPVCVPPVDRTQQGLKFYWRLFTNLFSPYPYIVTSHFSQHFQKQLNTLLQQDKYDIVLCEWTPYAIFIKDISHAKKIVVAHNIETSIWRRYEQNEKNPIRRFYISIQRAKVDRFEQSAFKWADGATAVSQNEADIISGWGVPYPVAVVDNGVDLTYFCSSSNEPTKSNSLVFTGSMDWRPNQDAMLYFTEQILPLVQKEVPDISITMVGRKPPREIEELAKDSHITVTGTVDDVRPYIAEASVYIVPLRIGGGSRLKILEAMAMGKAVISTSIGAEGLRVTDGEHLLIRDGEQAFTEGIISLLHNTDMRNRLGQAGRQLVEREYGWESIGQRLNKYLNTIARKV